MRGVDLIKPEPVVKQIQLSGETFETLIHNDLLEQRISEMARKITEDYEGICPVLVVVLNGAFIFAASLAKALQIPCEIEFIRLVSYEAKTSTGQVRAVLGLDKCLAGRDVIVVEDIVDTGLSMRFLLDRLGGENPRSVRVASLLFKPSALKEKIAPDYVGFEIENRFVVGYGLDFNGIGRNYPDLYVNIRS